MGSHRMNERQIFVIQTVDCTRARAPFPPRLASNLQIILLMPVHLGQAIDEVIDARHVARLQYCKCTRRAS